MPLRGAHLPRRLRFPLRPRVFRTSEGVVVVLPRLSLRPRVLRHDSEGPEGVPAPRGPRALAASRVLNQAGGNNRSPRVQSRRVSAGGGRCNEGLNDTRTITATWADTQR